MTDIENKALDEAVAKFRALMESQPERAKKKKEDKEFTDYKGGEKARKKTYNKGFRDAENSAGPIIF